jgi:hypothetical protein
VRESVVVKLSLYPYRPKNAKVGVMAMGKDTPRPNFLYTATGILFSSIRRLCFLKIPIIDDEGAELFRKEGTHLLVLEVASNPVL